jgi:hypothetical protein
MAVTQFFGFDNLEATGINLGGGVGTMLANEGYPLLVDVAGSMLATFETLKGRNWFKSNANYFQAQSYAILYASMGTLFGTGVKKRGWIGLRIYQASVQNSTEFSIVQQSSNILLYAQEIPAGESYVEFEFNWTTNRVRRFVDGVEISDAAFNPADTANFAFGVKQTTNYRQGGTVYYTDFYAVLDTEDDTPCSRLGSVRVRPLDLDEVTLPPDWETIQQTYAASVTIGGKVFPRPYTSFTVTPYHGFDYTCNALVRTGAILYHMYSPQSVVEFNVASPTPATPIWFMLKLPKPMKLGAYQQRRSTSNACYIPNAWKLEGSQDNVTWTLLDDQSGKANSMLPVNTIYNYEIPVEKRAEYLYYRVSFTGAQAVGAASYFQVCGLQFFLDPDVVLYTPIDILDADYWSDSVGSNETGGVVRTGIVESEMSAGIKKPNVGTEQILKVQLRVSALRDGGSENRLVAKVKQGATELPEQDLLLEPTIRQGMLVLDAHKAPDGTMWTADSIDALSVSIKSKTGAA